MSHVTTQDGVDIYYKDWGPRNAKALFFHHGWPLSSDDWDGQMLFFLQHGFVSSRTIVGVTGGPVRRGTGMTWTTMPTTLLLWCSI